MVARSYNGDGALSLGGRIAYLAQNRINNRAPYEHLDPGLSIADLDVRESTRLDELPGLPSPSRALCDLFWMYLPWDAIEQEVGPLRILDVGCGTGRYGVTLQAWSGARVARYLGIDRDPHTDWPRLTARHPYLAFCRGDAQAIGDLVPVDTNIFISQSTLEHVEDDISCLDQIHDYAHHYGRPMLSIHLIPSQACLWTYLWHGYRQYTPRTLSARTRRFADCSERLLVRLGGTACNALHYRFITWPLLILRRGDRRDTEPVRYREALRQAIIRDMRAPQPSAAFYALLIHSYARRSLGGAGSWRIRTRGK